MNAGNNPQPVRWSAGEIQVLASRQWISTADFAERCFRLVTGPSAGQNFRHDLSPYARMVMDIWDRPWTRKIFFVAPSQTTKTTIAYCCLAAEIYRDPAPAGVGMADEAQLKRAWSEKLHLHFSRSPALRSMLAEKDPLQQTRILLQGATIYGMWSGSEASMSSVTMRVLVIDEEDAYQDPQAAAVMEERTLSYPDDKKILRVSKPRGMGNESVIWKAMQRESQAVYQWQACCPVCGEYQIMVKDNITIPETERDPARIRHLRLARYKCAGCGSMWDDRMRNAAVAQGREYTESSAVRPEVVGVHLPSWYSRQVSLSDVMSDFVSAVRSGHPADLMAFDNAHKAMPGKVVTVEAVEDRVRAMITDRPPLEVPAEAWCLTMGIDVQMVGFYFVVRAWGRDYESWMVQHGFLDGWPEVEAMLWDARWPVEGRDGVCMRVWRAAIDTGGHSEAQDHKDHGWSQYQETMDWLYEHEHQGVVSGIKGAAHKQTAVVKPSALGRDPDARGRRQYPLVIRLLDTDYLKAQVQTRLSPQCRTAPMWLHSETGEDYISQICAEAQTMDKSGRIVWQRIRRANHFLDCEAYAAACIHTDWAPNFRQEVTQPLWEKTISMGKHHVHRPERDALAGLRVNPFAR